MQIEVSQDRMLVISDLHMGCSLFKQIHTLEKFFEFVKQNQFHLCINGDGIDLSQSSLMQMSRDVPVIFQQIAEMRSLGLKVYYVVGNHDIVLEHFLQDWGLFELMPFMNLTTKDKRIRIEHGHLYDTRYVTSPILFKWLEIFGGALLRFLPSIYHSYKWLEERFYGKDIVGSGGFGGKDSTYMYAVSELLERGFDAVILGHTHRPGVVKMGQGKVYINLGSWIHNSYFVQIVDGRVELREFTISKVSGVSSAIIYDLQ